MEKNLEGILRVLGQSLHSGRAPYSQRLLKDMLHEFFVIDKCRQEP